MGRWHPKTWAVLMRGAAKAWVADKATSMGAAVAFYSVLSLAPLFVVVIAIAGLFLGEDRAEQILLTEVADLIGQGGAEAIGALLESVDTEREGFIATAVGAFTLLMGATTVFAELKGDLDRIFKARAPKASGLANFVRTRFLSFGLVLAIAFLLMVSLVISTAVAALGEAWFAGGAKAALHGAEFVASMAVSTVLFATIYKFLPARRLPWSDVWIGGAVTALLFWIGKFLIGMYLGKSDVVTSFGAAGTLVLVILWVYYSSQVFFLGAEFAHQYAASVGSMRLPEESQPAGDTVSAHLRPEEEAIVKRARRVAKGEERQPRRRKA